LPLTIRRLKHEKEAENIIQEEKKEIKMDRKKKDRQ